MSFLQVFRSSNITVDMDLVRQIEAKYPAFLFKQQLTAFVEGLYGMIGDNVKKDLSSLLAYAIQVSYLPCVLHWQPCVFSFFFETFVFLVLYDIMCFFLH